MHDEFDFEDILGGDGSPELTAADWVAIKQALMAKVRAGSLQAVTLIFRMMKLPEYQAACEAAGDAAQDAAQQRAAKSRENARRIREQTMARERRETFETRATADEAPHATGDEGSDSRAFVSAEISPSESAVKSAPAPGSMAALAAGSGHVGPPRRAC